jgi:hypothetical protein
MIWRRTPCDMSGTEHGTRRSCRSCIERQEDLHEKIAESALSLERAHDGAANDYAVKRQRLPWRERAAVAATRASWPRRVISFLKGHAVVLTLVGGAVWALITTGGDAYGKLLVAWEWWRVDQTYTGRWSNDGEGDLDPPIQVQSASGQPTELSLFVRGSEVEGEFYTSGLCGVVPWQVVRIRGRPRWWGFGGIRAYAWEYIRGQRTILTEVGMKYDRTTKTLEILPIGESPVLPTPVRLFKVANEVGTPADKIEPFCPGYIERMTEAAAAKSGRPASAPSALRPASSPPKASRQAPSSNTAPAARRK